MKKINYLLILLILIASCKEKHDTEGRHIINFNERKEIKLNWKHPQKFILLDNSSEDAFIGAINRVIIKNDRVYILDHFRRGRNRVLCFDTDGNFIRRYGQPGRGPGEHSRLYDFDVGPEGDVFLFCHMSTKVIHLHENVSLINEYRFDFRANGLKLLKQGEFLFSLANENEHNHQFSVYCPNTKEMRNFFSFDGKDQTNRSIKRYTQPFQGGFTAYTPVRDEFYIFNESGDLQEVFEFNFGKHTLPHRYKFDALTWENVSGNFFFLDATPVLINDFIIGEIRSVQDMSPYMFIYNTRDHELFVDRIEVNNYSHKSLYPYLGVYNGHIINALDLELFEASNEKESLPQHVTAHIKEGGVVIAFSLLHRTNP